MARIDSKPAGCIVKWLIFLTTNVSPTGSGHEYSDLDEVMKKMEHWAHRLYPKLPFDDVTDRIAVLGKKMVSSFMGTHQFKPPPYALSADSEVSFQLRREAMGTILCDANL